jgi:heat-inducible transcriptional repressor
MDPKPRLALDERSREILQWAISTYVVTGKPVGSRTLARRSHEHLSAATVRNIMADLEEMGYLRQPHPSAGRIPTDKGYRLYVDFMLKKHEISPRERQLIDRSLMSGDSPDQLMARTSQVLSHVSKNLGIVVSPPISQVALQHIQFIKLSENRILVILVSKAGIVQNRVLHPSEEFTQTDLDRAARYIIEHFKDKTLAEIKSLLSKMIGEERALYDQFVRCVAMLSTQTFSEASQEVESEVYLDGASNLIKNPEFSDISRMRMLFETIGHKSRLASLISECIKGDSQEVRITIGTENVLPGIEDCTLIASRYVVDEKTVGSLGILGPTRMEYARAISLVEYVARIVGQVLGCEGTRP